MEFSLLSHNTLTLPRAEVDTAAFITQPALLAGFGVYESLRIDQGALHRLSDHLARLQTSAELVALQHPWSSAELEAAARSIVAATVARDGHTDFNLRMLLLGGDRARDAQLWMEPVARSTPPAEAYTQGVTTTIEQVSRFLPNAKTIGQLAPYLAARRARAQGHFDVLLAEPDGLLTEGSRANLIGIRNGTLLTAPAATVLGGVTLQTVLETAEATGIPVEQSGLYRDQLASLDALALCGTSIGILPVRNCNAVDFDPGNATLQSLMTTVNIR